MNTIDSINTNNMEYSETSEDGSIGLSLYFDELYPYLNDSLFKGYLMNSKLKGNIYSLFHQTIHFPLGYKFNCSSYIYGTENITCLYELQK